MRVSNESRENQGMRPGYGVPKKLYYLAVGMDSWVQMAFKSILGQTRGFGIEILNFGLDRKILEILTGNSEYRDFLNLAI